jgi:hypothetical protein
MRALVVALSLLALSLLALLPPAHAVVGGVVSRDPDGLRRSVVRVESSRGELCSGTVIAPDLVLTAAHCLMDRGAYRVVGVDRAFRPRAVQAVAAASHPEFVPGTTPRNQPGVDLAILKLAQPLGPEFAPLAVGSTAIGRGEAVDIAGFGITGEGRAGSAKVLRQVRLVSLGTLQVANRVVIVADGRRLAERTGAGACRGDSGGPVLSGGRLVGIVSWSSGALSSRRSACGGFTAVTPIADNAAWIGARVRELAGVQVGTQ